MTFTRKVTVTASLDFKDRTRFLHASEGADRIEVDSPNDEGTVYQSADDVRAWAAYYALAAATLDEANRLVGKAADL